MINIRVDFQLTENEVQKIAHTAMNFHRPDPQKSWNKQEFIAAARIAIEQTILREYELEDKESKYLEKWNEKQHYF